MSRLIVEAISREVVKETPIDFYHLNCFVSVAYADDGIPVTGLGVGNFRVCVYGGLFQIVEIGPAQGELEAKWEPNNAESAGCYSLYLTYKSAWLGRELQKWKRGDYYAFGVQALVRDQAGHVIHQGQTVMRIQSLGI